MPVKLAHMAYQPPMPLAPMKEVPITGERPGSSPVSGSKTMIIGGIVGVIILAIIVFLVVLPMLSGTSREVQENKMVEYDEIDLTGSDYVSKVVANAAECSALCFSDSRCKAATDVKPSTIQGPFAHCWMKNTTPLAVSNKNCISWIKNAGSV